MSLSEHQILIIEDTLRQSLRNKFAHYTPETNAMPFHTRLLGKDRLALYSFIHSLSTNFGTSIFEPVAVSLATGRFKIAKSHIVSGNQISEKVLFLIQKIMDGLTAASEKPNKPNEIEQIRRVATELPLRKIKPTLVDLYLEKENGDIFLFDLKTVKPNKGGFKEFKRTLLEWVGVTLSENPKTTVHSIIAIPYNPYEPKPYSRWTMAGMLDLENELKVGKEFWDFVGGDGAYEELLNCFERVGIEMRKEIDDYFMQFSKG